MADGFIIACFVVLLLAAMVTIIFLVWVLMETKGQKKAKWKKKVKRLVVLDEPIVEDEPYIEDRRI